MKTYYLVLMMGLLSSASSFAEANPDLSSYFDQKLSKIEDSIATIPPSSRQMEIQDINLDFTPSISVGVNSVLSLSISPEIDFVLTPN
jgi:hypothetical protein